MTATPYLPTSMQVIAFNVDAANVQAAKDFGFDAIALSRIDENGADHGSGIMTAGDNMLAALAAANMPFWAVPGRKANDSAANASPFTYDTRSMADSLLGNPLCRGFLLIDEDDTVDRANGAGQPLAPRHTPAEDAADIAYYNSRADALGKPHPAIWDNNTPFTYTNEGLRARLNVDGVSVFGSDNYYADYNQARLIGTQGSGFPFTTTQEDMSAYFAVMKPTFHTSTSDAPVAALNKPFIPYLQLGPISNNGDAPFTPSVPEVDTQAWSTMGSGAVHMAAFITNTGNPFIVYNPHSKFKKWIADFKADCAAMQTYLFAPGGGRTPFDTYRSVLAPGSSPPVADKGVVWPAVTGASMQGGFHMVRYWNPGKTAFTLVITNLTKDAQILTSLPSGSVTGMTLPTGGIAFGPLQKRRYLSTDATFATDQFPARTGWMWHADAHIADLVNLPAGSVIGGRDITNRAIRVDAQNAVYNNGGALPTTGDGTGATGGLQVTYTPPGGVAHVLSAPMAA